MSVRLKLESLEYKKVRDISGNKVLRLDESTFIINGESHNLESALKLLGEKPKLSEESKYVGKIFILVEPPARIISAHNIATQDEYDKLLQLAKKKKVFIYFADVISKSGKNIAEQPWLIDWRSVSKESMTSVLKASPEDDNITSNSDVVESSSVSNDDFIVCPYCSKKMNSLFGRTNHVKSKHPEMLEEYKSKYA